MTKRNPVYFGCDHTPVCPRRWMCSQRAALLALVKAGEVTMAQAEHLIALWLAEDRPEPKTVTRREW